ncbi:MULTISPECIES: hypothetical protein [unclassified Paenibacillus]|uniref:hypothetical protein n=1 Tax=unclassified Paenibacillus TaxID=185978 RepID=UPI0008385F5B|nr:MULTISPECIES: hypothetical protein [unclassified Paenibacillus]NWL86704.1 hypothetical protein [Paenibacillus sp. 79R4]
MAKLLYSVGGVLILAGLLSGFLYFGWVEHAWGAAFTVIGSGFLSGIIFVALGAIIERLDMNAYYLEELLDRTPPLPESNKPRPAKHSYLKDDYAKTPLEALKGYKMNAKD